MGSRSCDLLRAPAGKFVLDRVSTAFTITFEVIHLMQVTMRLDERRSESRFIMRSEREIQVCK